MPKTEEPPLEISAFAIDDEEPLKQSATEERKDDAKRQLFASDENEFEEEKKEVKPQSSASEEESKSEADFQCVDHNYQGLEEGEASDSSETDSQEESTHPPNYSRKK